MYDHQAVYVKNAHKSYENSKILDNLSMCVDKGTIYGLLGASGCGKTTLLNCIIGRKRLDNGEVWTLGEKSGEKDRETTGSKIGYMPQDIALVPEYTVEETIYFFGRIANMKGDAIYTRFYHLSKLLELPLRTHFVRNCSGGEQRRISLACAIVHEPELLILDEPTVGLDSVLRDKIWGYLLDQVRRGISVVMTTHYVDECKDANKIGFMRNGKLLAEQSPHTIMSIHHCETLEQSFFKICLNEEQGNFNYATNPDLVELQKDTPSTSIQSFNIADYESSEDLINHPDKHPQKVHRFLGINSMRLQALLHKNWTQFKRNTFGLFLFGVLPVSQTFFFLYCIGGDVKNLDLGVVNDEVPGRQCVTYDRQLTVLPNIKTNDCQFRNLSCRFLEHLDHPMIKTITYDLTADATEDVRHGKIIGFLYVPTNFSKSYQERIEDIEVRDSTLEFGTIQAYLDMSNKATGGNLKFKLLEFFLDFQDDLYRECMWDERLGKSQIHEKYLFGKKEDSFLIFMLPGLILTFGFYFGSTMTSQIIVSEKCEGVWDRSLVAGVTVLEMACGHLLLQMAISTFHGITPIVISLFIYGIEYQGSVMDMIIISIIQNACGLAFGFWISVMTKTHTQAHFMITGLLFPSILLSGLMWPLEGLPYLLQIVGKVLPMTLPILALRNIIRKGWSLWNYKIILANSVPLAWLVGLILLSLLQIRKIK